MLEAMFLGGLIGLALVIWAVSWFVKAASTQSREARDNAPKVLDEVFNGDPLVSYDAGFAALDYETVVMGGIERGYELHAQHTANRTYGVEKLIFKKVD